jgi:hypothetical protein
MKRLGILERAKCARPQMYGGRRGGGEVGGGMPVETREAMTDGSDKLEGMDKEDICGGKEKLRPF